MIEQQETVRRAFSLGSVVMLIWCALMLVLGETGAAVVSWCLAVVCVFSARERREL